MIHPDPISPASPYQVAVCKSVPQATGIVRQLLAAGFARTEISVISQEHLVPQFEAIDVEADPPAGEVAPEAAVAGGTLGALLGGTGAMLGLIATGGVPIVIAGGALFAAATGAVAGSLIGLMTARGIEPDMADYYEQALRRNEILVVVHIEGELEDDRRSRAAEIFERNGAEAISFDRS